MIYSDPACTDFVDTPVLAAAPYLRQVLAAFACPLMSMRLMRLAPRSLIKEHRDHDLAYEDGRVRIHIPVLTNEQVHFRLNGVRWHHAGRIDLVSPPLRPAQRGKWGHQRAGAFWSSMLRSMPGWAACSRPRSKRRPEPDRLTGAR